MKYTRQFFTAMLLCMSVAAFAQPAQSLRVINRTNCTVYFSALADPTPCGLTYVSSIIALSPGPGIFYPSSTVIPGLTTFPPSLITSARLYSSPTCGAPSIWHVGNPCTGFPLAQAIFVLTPTCSVCSQTITAKWTPAPSPGGTATLEFF